jgi:hypothetical protein
MRGLVDVEAMTDSILYRSNVAKRPSLIYYFQTTATLAVIIEKSRREAACRCP